MILLKVLEYLAYKVQYADFNAADITEDFSTRIDPYIALELYVISYPAWTSLESDANGLEVEGRKADPRGIG